MQNILRHIGIVLVLLMYFLVSTGVVIGITQCRCTGEQTVELYQFIDKVDNSCSSDQLCTISCCNSNSKECKSHQVIFIKENSQYDYPQFSNFNKEIVSDHDTSYPVIKEVKLLVEDFTTDIEDIPKMFGRQLNIFINRIITYPSDPLG